MKIIEQTPSKLTVQQQPTKTWIVGVICLVGLSYIFYCIDFGLPIHSTLNCEKDREAQVNCLLLESSLLNHNFTNIWLKDLRQARVKWSIFSSDAPQSHPLVLTTYSKSFPLVSSQTIEFPTNTMLIFVSRGEAKKIVSRLNTFIGDNSAISYVKFDLNMGIIYFIFTLSMCLLCCFGMLVAVSKPITTCVFDKNINSFTLKQKPLFGDEIAQQSHNLSEISAIQWSEETRGDVTYYSVTLIIAENQEQYILGEYNREKIARNTITRINNFLT